MKANIHPKFYDNATVICSCGARHTIGSTQEVIHVELCKTCHPFYTGEQRFVDSASRIKKFQEKQNIAKQYVSKKVKKEAKRKEDESRPKTLREMLEQVR